MAECGRPFAESRVMTIGDNDDARDPGLVLRDGVPVSTRFDDVYYSRDGGLAESAHVFLSGVGLPGSWAGRPAFTIAETGFGTGLNFLATWEVWRRHRPAGAVLHYLAVEGYPIRRGTLATVLAPFRPVAGLAAQLIDRYPRPDPGLHRLWFPEDRVCLTLAVGQAAAILPTLDAVVDAWFLDGFAPARNPSMWEPAVLDQVARLAAPGCRLASFTVAGAVRRGLEARGFAVERRPGFGGKRECLAATRLGPPTAASIRPARVAVVGAGIAGAALAGALRRRGMETAWLERRSTLAAEASGNPVGVLMPRPTLVETAAGRLSAAALRHVLAECARHGVAVGGHGVLELAIDPTGRARHERLRETGLLASVDGRLVAAPEASRIAGVALEYHAVHYGRGGWVSPSALVAAQAEGAVPTLDRGVAALRRSGDHWFLHDSDGRVLVEADAVILATGAGGGFAELAAVPLTSVRGQLSLLRETELSRRLRVVLAFGGYVAPAVGGRHVVGATYDRTGFDPGQWPQPVTADGHARTLAGLPTGIGRWFDGVAAEDGRAALRMATPDRMPVAGSVPQTAADAGSLRPTPGFRRPPEVADQEGLFILSGLGSRGLVTAPLLAELVVGRLLGEPSSVERDVAEAVHPARFAARARRRN